MTRRALPGLAILALAAGCAETPERVADRFMDRYFVEIDQARARPLTSGLASKKLDDELQLVEGIRRTYSAAEARPRVHYERRSFEGQGERARAVYRLHIDRDGDAQDRSVLLTLERVSGRWTVANFVVAEASGSPQD